MPQHEAVLFANEAFYLAFRTRDFAAMEDIWAAAVPVSCIHPGWHALHGRDEVLESWQAILEGQGAPDISCHAAQAHVYGDCATVICFEEIEGNYLIATNVFFREPRGWKIVHHQAAPTSGSPPDDTEDDPEMIN